MVDITVFLTDMQRDFGMNKVYREHFDTWIPPAGLPDDHGNRRPADPITVELMHRHLGQD